MVETYLNHVAGSRFEILLRNWILNLFTYETNKDKPATVFLEKFLIIILEAFWFGKINFLTLFHVSQKNLEMHTLT